jgi:hypothetical protein
MHPLIHWQASLVVPGGDSSLPRLLLDRKKMDNQSYPSKVVETAVRQ